MNRFIQHSFAHALALIGMLTVESLAPRQASAGDDIVKTCIAALQSKSDSIAYRREACRRLQELGTSAEPAIPALMDALKDDQLDYWAACALRGIGPEARKAIEQSIKPEAPGARSRLLFTLVLSELAPYRTLVDSLNAREETIRYWAIDTLARVARVYPQLAKDLAGKFELVARGDKDAAVRCAAAFSLAEMMPNDERTLRVVTVVLIDKNAHPTARAKAAHIVGSFGMNGRYAELALLAALGDSDPVLRQRAAVSLGRISADRDETPAALRRLAVEAASMGYKDLYHASENAAEAISKRAQMAKNREANQKRAEDAIRKAKETQARIEKEIIAHQNRLIEAKMRSDKRVFGLAMTFGRQANLDNAAHCSQVAGAYQDSAKYWSSLGQTEQANSCHDAAAQYDRWADWHRDWARKVDY